MSVQVCVGRAGTGKTWLCLDAIRARFRENAAEGHRLIFLVPEQAAFQMERTLIETEGLAGYSRCEVLSFRRLAHRVFNEVGAGTRRPLGALGRLMAVKLLLTRLKPQLRVIKPSGHGTGLLNQLATSIQEWLQEDLKPEALRDLAEKRKADDPLAAERLFDLHLIYTAYREYLDEGRLDPAQELAVAEPLLEKLGWLHGAEVWVDGFAGFTELERRMLVRLASLAKAMTITLLIDPASTALRSAAKPLSRFSLFARTERTYAALRDSMRDAGIEWVELPPLSPSAAPRFGSPELARLEREIFAPGRSATAGAPGEYANVKLVAAANRRIEVDAAVAEIQRLVRTSNGGIRYRDIAVIVRDLEPYHELLSAALAAGRIPFFIDRRRGTAVHPLVELLRLLPLLAANRLAIEDVRLLLKTGLVPLNDETADALENYVIAHGIGGLEAWLGPADWGYRRLFNQREDDAELTEHEKVSLAKVNECRRSLVEPLRGWLDFASRMEPPTGREWAAQILDTLKALKADARIGQWSKDAADDGQAEEADVHKQVWRDAMEFLDELVDSLGSEPMSAGELAGILDAGLAEFTLGLAPPTLDQVLVGSIERSRHPELAAVLLLGFCDGLFPISPKEDVLLRDDEREQLSSSRPPMGTTRRQRILDEKMLAYIALTRASRSLWLSYPRADDTGRPLRPSPFVADIRAALPGLTEVQMDDPTPTRALWSIGRPRELGARLAMEFRQRPLLVEQDDTEVRRRWNSLFQHARTSDTLAHDLRPILASLTYDNAVSLREEQVRAIAQSIRHFSASRLETFAACPFRHFARYVLGLEPRVEFEIQAIDFGLLHHKLLEMFYGALIAEKKPLATLSDDDMRKRLERLSGEWIPKLTDEALLDDARNKFLLQRSGSHLFEALLRQRLMSVAGRFAPAMVEWSFGFKRSDSKAAESAAPLEITTPAGRTITLVGKIDRVDVLELAEESLGVVLDYKSGDQRVLQPWKMLHGIDVQLLTYLLAIQQRGQSPAGRPIRPIGAFYVSIKPYRESVKHPDKAPPPDAMPSERKARGALQFEHSQDLDSSLGNSVTSKLYSVSWNKDGKLSHARYSDAYDAAQWKGMLEFAKRRLGELADAILDGDVSVRPYRVNTTTACRYCEHRPVCRFDYDVDENNEITPMGREDALKAMGIAVAKGT